MQRKMIVSIKLQYLSMSQELSQKEITNVSEKLNRTPETERPIKENSDDLNNALKTMILDNINKL